MTLYPANVELPPLASDVNVMPGEALPNLTVVQLDDTGDANTGDIKIFNGAGIVNAAIDVEGWFQ